MPSGTLFKVRFLTWTKEVYRPLRKALSQAGYRYGELDDPQANLSFFSYDWRRSNLDTAQNLHAALELLASGRTDPRLHLICQSSAARVCRYLVKHGGLSLSEAEAGLIDQPRYRVTKLILIGASNGGSIRQLHELNRGRRYVPGAGRFLAPETLFTLRPLFGDLPADSGGLFVDRSGRPLDVDLYSAESWIRYGWSVFAPEIEQRLATDRRPDLFGDRDDRMQYLQQMLDEARRVHRLLEAASPGFPGTRYYLLLNESQVTPSRAALEQIPSGAWRTVFSSDRSVRRDLHLHALLTGYGDGHATRASQIRLSEQERLAIAGTRQVTGGHFNVMLTRAAHEALIDFLAEEEPPPAILPPLPPTTQAGTIRPLRSAW